VRVEGEAALRRLFAAPDATIASLCAGDPEVVEWVTNPLRGAEAVISYLSLVRDFHLPSE
jgi:hypothetical protein